MADAKSLSQWPFRSTLNNSEELGVKAEPTTLAGFTPDIIPLDQVSATPNEIAVSYKHFVSHAIDLEEKSTLVYLRAKAADAPHSTPPPKVDLYAMENHLVPWPQLLQLAQHVGSTELQVARKDVVVGAPIAYKPIPLQDTSRHATLIAVQNQVDPGFAALAKAVLNWRDLVKLVGKDDTVAFYNVVMADPCASHVKLTSRLELPDNEQSAVDLYIGLEAVSIPVENIEAILSVADKHKTHFTLGRQALVTLEIFNEEKLVFGDYSSVSIALFAVAHGGGPEGSETLIGAEHVVFDSNPRVKRLVRKYKPSSLRQGANSSESNNGAVPQFYFRATVEETAYTEKDAGASCSPDIQPVALTSNQSNYIYLRGYTTVPHKREYSNPDQIVNDYTSGGDPYVAIRKYDTTQDVSGTQQIIFDVPFLLSDLSPPPSGNDHYCLIAECKPNRTDQGEHDGMPPYKWPHEDTDQFETTAEYHTWIYHNRRVAQRNINFRCENDGESYNKRQSFSLASLKSYSPSETYNYGILAINCPIGSAIAMDSTDVDIVLATTPISTKIQHASAGFTGKPHSFTCQVNLHWYVKGYSKLQGQSLAGQLSVYGLTTSNAAKSKPRLAEDSEVGIPKPKKRQLHVGEAYPTVIVASRYRAPGRLRLGGAVRARRLTKRPRDKREAWQEFVLGRDTVVLG
ncbi:hypothetical protein K438DRAFT_1988847 [Mycena galopus ATCC 62051]|nr:hypothetical protein K438DRAFT_1988847 [Mycena galopus ATCC 62051]